MTVKELKEELKKYPNDMEVFLAERKTFYSYGLLVTVGVQTIRFGCDSVPEEEHAFVDCVVLEEEA